MSTKANATATADTVIAEVFIAAPVERVFQALVRPEQLRQCNEDLARKDYIGGWPGVLAMLKTFTEKK